MYHGPRWFQESGLADVMAGLLPLNGTKNEGAKFLIARAAEHVAVEVVVGLRKEAGADFAVGGEADTAACAAEGLRYRGNDADFALAVGKAVTASGLACFERGQLDQWENAADALNNFG